MLKPTVPQRFDLKTETRFKDYVSRHLKFQCTGKVLPTYREIQQDCTPEIEVFYMLFDRFHTKKNRKRFFKQHIKYFNFRVKLSWATLKNKFNAINNFGWRDDGD